MAQPEPTIDDMRAVAALLPELERVQASPLEWRVGGGQMPHAENVAVVNRVMQEVYDHHLLIDFNWGGWQDEAKRFLDPAVLSEATLDDLRRLLTVHVRTERFSRGHFAEMVQSGHIAAILKRVGELAA